MSDAVEGARDRLLRIVKGKFRVRRGHPLPYGASARREGVNFSVFSRHATAVTLVLFVPGDEEPVLELPLDPRYNKTGEAWHVLVEGLDPGIEYGFRADREDNDAPQVLRFDRGKILIDPYSKAVAGLERWGEVAAAKGRLERLRSRVVDEEFDWGHEHPLAVPLADSVIYELHVRGFTRHPSSGVRHPGTFRGLVEKIPYLRDLGVTAVELMPVTEFEEGDNPRTNLLTGEPLRNFWGYQPVSFFAPKASYAANGAPGEAVREFKAMVKAFHEAEIEVILDIVFNHTGEGDERGATFCWRGLDNPTYYILEPGSGKYLNYSGCGNTLNCNHPVVRFQILSALRYWVTEMHVDGFRFDLASILGRGRDGEVLPNPPLLEAIAADPVMADVKLIAEAWDAAGLYQVGSFPSWGRWAEWNGRFRDEVRRFVKSDPGLTKLLATRLAGSPDLYRGSERAPWHSINFLTSHDGFTLADLVSYNDKHNWANGEGNTDGHPENLSWNCGEEGPSSNGEVLTLRARQQRNFLTLLFLSQGVPMLQAGDELGRTQGGNNNAYCQDNEVSWVDWSLLERNAPLLRFTQRLVRFRKAHPSLRRRTFLDDEPTPAVAWHGVKLGKPDWTSESRTLGMHLLAGADEAIYLVANAHWEPRAFELPKLSAGKSWRRFVDTSLPPGKDALEPGAEVPVAAGRTYPAGPRSVVVLVGR
ncbi:MAG TPA: glycogen debranching protein GlgX [Vicinamibacteria bacterium]|nr:glycogen debranching protein GlgX [Vicinamibacteria bacterium]